MAWADVAAQLRAMGEAVTPLVTKQGMRASFRYVTEASEDSPPRTRDFYFEVVSGSKKGNMRPARRSYADCALSIFYEEARDWGQRNEIIVGDYEAFRDYFTDTTNWGRPTSTIESIALFDGDSILEYVIERVEGGAVLQIRFPVEYTG